MRNFEFLFLNFQTYIESSVSFSYFLWLNDLFWLLYLSLNVVLVNPMYATCSFSADTVALYTIQLERHIPSSGHLVCCQQLHVVMSPLCVIPMCNMSPLLSCFSCDPLCR